MCDNTPAAGYCVLELSGAPGVSCVKAGTLRGNGSCDLCEPSTSQVAWSDGEGRPCDDGDPCTMGDICSSGACQGLDYGYLCNDGLYCTDDLCDGLGGCAGSKLQPGFCVVNALCYKHQQLHPHGACSRCDVGSSTTSWTPFTGGCVIDGSCYPPGFQPGPCASCDTSKSTTAWTIASGSCLIDNSCHKAGDKDAGGCSRCDPAKSATAWTTCGPPMPGTGRVLGRPPVQRTTTSKSRAWSIWGVMSKPNSRVRLSSTTARSTRVSR